MKHEIATPVTDARVAPLCVRALYISTAVVLTGCAGFSRVQDSVAKFDQGAHAISTSEIAFLRAGQAADCDYQFYSQAWNFVKDPSPTPAVSLVTGATCVPQVLDDQDIAVRQKLMNALVLYADQLQAIGSGGADKSLATDGQSDAGDFNKLIKSVDGAKPRVTSIGADVEAAVNGLLDMVMDARQFKDIKAAASQESGNLATVVGLLKAENTQLALNMSAKASDISLIFDTTLAYIKQAGVITAQQSGTGSAPAILRANNYGLLLDAVEARRVIQAIDLLGNPATPAAGSSGAAAPPAANAPSSSSAGRVPAIASAAASTAQRIACKNDKALGARDPPSPTTDADVADQGTGSLHQVNAALDALVTANSAIAQAAGPGCLGAVVADLATRAQAAQTMTSALDK